MILVNPKRVLLLGVTGGVGEAVGDKLVALGYETYVACRTPQQRDHLQASGKFKAVVLLDLGNTSSIDQAFADLKALGVDSLDGFINCAATLHGSPLETVPAAEMQYIMQTNLFGTLHAVQLAIPLLRPTKGRIVLVGSLSGTWVMPLTGMYCASKFALEAVCDGLRRELYPWGIKVVLVKPGGIKTRMSMGHVEDVKREMENLEGNARLYQPLYRAHALAVPKSFRYATPPENIADDVIKGLRLRTPRARYFSGVDCKIMGMLAWLLPDSALDWIARKTFPLN